MITKKLAMDLFYNVIKFNETISLVSLKYYIASSFFHYSFVIAFT